MVDAIGERLPPAEIEAESAVLGAMILNPKTIPDVLAILAGRTDFYYPSNGELFSAIATVYGRNNELDLITLQAELRQRGTLDEIGGLSKIESVAASAPVASSAEHYAKLVSNAAKRRRIIAAGVIVSKAGLDIPDAENALEAAQAALMPLTLKDQNTDIAEISDILKNAMATAIDTNETTISTGLIDLDEMTNGGLRAGEIMVLAGRPSMGKTACAITIALAVAKSGKRVLIQSMEMAREQIGSRLIAMESGVPYSRFVKRDLDKEDYRKASQAVGRLDEMPITIDDTGALSINQLRSRIRRAAMADDLGIVVIDYLQLMNGGVRFNNRQEEVSSISRGIKAMARENGVPIVLLAQLNRGPDARTDQRPRMSDLRESGAVEQDADIVALLYREDYYKKTKSGYQATNVTELIIDKHRNGATGVVRLHFNPEIMVFQNAERRSQWG
jgi:replicative DNA helicase